MLLTPRLLLGLVLAGATLGACQPNAPVAEEKPRRKSFEDSSSWQPASAPASGTSSTEAQARQVGNTWEQVEQAKDDAEKQRLAGEALRQTRAMAEEPSTGPQ